MKKLIYSMLIGGVLTCTMACRKYVEIPPEQVKVLSTAADYQQLLYNSTTIDPAYYYPIFSGDDAGSDETRWQTSLVAAAANSYIWADKIYGSTEEDLDWQNAYKRIYIYNTIIDGVLSSTGSEQEKQLALSAALVHRAFDYFTLANIYAKQYDSSTASSDPGVPLVLHPKFLTDLTRASVQAVYDQIKADLNASFAGLPNLPDFNSNPAKVSAYAIMARVLLNTRAFTEAERYANLSLSLQSTILDLNNYKASTATYPTKISNQEELLIKRTTQYPLAFPLSIDAENMYDKTNDLRYTIFTVPGATLPGTTFTVSRGYFKSRITNDGGYLGPSTPETTLIKAECEARANNTATALTILNDFRKKRYNNATPYVNLTAATPDAALHLIIDERKREFVARGFRWFDQRRLSKDAGFIGTVTRVFKGVTYILEPGSNRYTYPIADKYIALNPEITQNPR
jgi:hypothetical protein